MKRGIGRCSGGISESCCCLLGGDDIERDAGTHLETGQLRQAWHDGEVPAELAGATRSGAHPHVQRRQPAKRGLKSCQCVVKQLCTQRTVVRNRTIGPSVSRAAVEVTSLVVEAGVTTGAPAR